MKTGVTVDAKEVLKHLGEAGDLLTGKDASIAVFAHKQHTREIAGAFASKRDPSGARWAPRRHSYPWELLNHTGTLRGTLLSGFGVKTKDKRMKIFGKVRDGFYLGGYSRGGGGSVMGARKPSVVVAASVMYGRKHGRSAAGMKTSTRKGITRSKFHGGGSKLKTAASTGTTPPRPFFGFGQMAKFRIRRFAAREIKQVFS